MGGPSPRTFDELLRYVQDEMQLLGRRRSSVTRDDIEALGLRIARSQEWAAKGGPKNITGAYRTTWEKGLDSGGTIDAHSDAGGILIGEAGIYEITAQQRGGPNANPANDYIGIALDGDRSALENRAGGVWTHDHCPGSNLFTTSRYIGALNAGERITAGHFQTSPNYLSYGPESIRGTLTVRRIS
jgi:hypothetical protein